MNYDRISREYYKKIQPHLYVKDGLSGYTRENASFSLTVFELIGIISTIGLYHFTLAANNIRKETEIENTAAIADGLVALIKNNPVSGSPRLDENVIDISLGVLLLLSTGKDSAATEWISELIKRVDFTFRVKNNFPIDTDSIDDLVDFTVFNDEATAKKLMEMSWMLPTLAMWAAIFNLDDSYSALSNNSKSHYPDTCLQLWHPTDNVWQHLYFQNACRVNGETEAPITLPESVNDFREQMKGLLELSKFNVLESSPGFKAGLVMIDFIAYRHFRSPVPPFLCYTFGGLGRSEISPSTESNS